MNEQAENLLSDYQNYYSEPTRRHLVKWLWKYLYSLVREKGYGIYCGYHQDLRDFAITGHVDGWPSVWFASFDGMLHAHQWLAAQGPALSEEERIEQKRVHWEERKAIEADYIQHYW